MQLFKFFSPKQLQQPQQPQHPEKPTAPVLSTSSTSTTVDNSDFPLIISPAEIVANNAKKSDLVSLLAHLIQATECPVSCEHLKTPVAWKECGHILEEESAKNALATTQSCPVCLTRVAEYNHNAVDAELLIKMSKLFPHLTAPELSRSAPVYVKSSDGTLTVSTNSTPLSDKQHVEQMLNQIIEAEILQYIQSHPPAPEHVIVTVPDATPAQPPASVPVVVTAPEASAAASSNASSTSSPNQNMSLVLDSDGVNSHVLPVAIVDSVNLQKKTLNAAGNNPISVLMLFEKAEQIAEVLRSLNKGSATQQHAQLLSCSVRLKLGVQDCILSLQCYNGERVDVKRFHYTVLFGLSNPQPNLINEFLRLATIRQHSLAVNYTGKEKTPFNLTPYSKGLDGFCPPVMMADADYQRILTQFLCTMVEANVNVPGATPNANANVAAPANGPQLK